jgi:hypothetical protein
MDFGDGKTGDISGITSMTKETKGREVQMQKNSGESVVDENHHSIPSLLH